MKNKENNQKWQKIKLYGSLTTKELKTKHSSRWVGRVETGNQGGEDLWQISSWRNGQVRQRLAVPHLCADNQEEQLGSETDQQTTQPRVPAWEKKALKPLAVKNEGFSGGRNSWPHRRVYWRDPRGLTTYTNPPIWVSAPEGPQLLWVVGKVTENQQRAKRVAVFPL